MKKSIKCLLIYVVIISFVLPLEAQEVFQEQEMITPESEVFEATHTKVLVREHALTREPYVSIVAPDVQTEREIMPGEEHSLTRPDYRMLSYKVKAGDIPYDGPYSDRRKVYIFAGTMIAAGVATAVVGAVAPAAATAGVASAGSVAAYSTAGTAVGVVTLSSTLLKMRPDPHRDDFTHTSKVRLIEYYGMRADESQTEEADIDLQERE